MAAHGGALRAGGRSAALRTRPDVRTAAWQRWQAAAGPWRAWSICPALLSPEADLVQPRREWRPAAASIAEELAKAVEQIGVLLLLDLEPILGLHVATRLN